MCKMAHFGNCDPETANQEYCIFHKPNKTEEEAKEFYRKFVLRFFGYKLPWNEGWVFAGPVDASGFVFPEIPNVPIPYGNEKVRFSFEYAEFRDNAFFNDAIFESKISFRNAKFRKCTLFQHTTFKDDTNFEESEFIYVDFSEAIFEKNTSFENASFGSKAMPFSESSVAVFGETEFNSHVSFENSEFFGSVYFGAKFHKAANFSNCVFYGNANFGLVNLAREILPLYCELSGLRYIPRIGSPSVFKGRAWFGGAIFCKSANFQEVEFKDIAIFENAIFCNPDEHYTVDFQRARFERWTTFSSAVFNGYVTFESAIFGGSISDDEREIEFKNTTFYGTTRFFNAQFNANANFYKARFKDTVNTFSRITFGGDAQFSEVIFAHGVSFEGSIFEGTARFIETKFSSRELFEKALKEGRSIKAADFTDAVFRGISTFVSSIFWGDAIFDQVIFERTVIFSKKNDKDSRPMFYGLMSFANCDFRQGIKLVERDEKNDKIGKIETQLKSLFYRDSPVYFHALQEGARVQRLSFEKKGKREEADQMFVIEMRARRRIRMQKAKAQQGKLERCKVMGYNFIEWTLGDFPSNYGTAWARLLFLTFVIPIAIFPLIYLLGMNSIKGVNLGIIVFLLIVATVIGVFTSQFFDKDSKKELAIHTTVLFFISLGAFYWFFRTFNVVGSIYTSTRGSVCQPIKASGIEGFFNIVYYSLVTFTTLGYGDMHPTGWLKIVSGLEALTGAVFMALIVAVIARKWMR